MHLYTFFHERTAYLYIFEVMTADVRRPMHDERTNSHELRRRKFWRANDWPVSLTNGLECALNRHQVDLFAGLFSSRHSTPPVPMSYI